jgi:hypothetical protein
VCLNKIYRRESDGKVVFSILQQNDMKSPNIANALIKLSQPSYLEKWAKRFDQFIMKNKKIL